MLPIFGAIVALATISTAGISAYYGIIHPIITNKSNDKLKAELIASRDKLIKSWINCESFTGLEGSVIYTARTSLLKELDVYNMATSFNIIKFVNGKSPAINDDRVTNVGLENVVEITVKNMGHARITCKNITIFYVKNRIRLESKAMVKKRVTFISPEKTHVVAKDVLVLDFEDYISISEPEMKEYQVQHILFDLRSETTVPIMINVMMKNKDYLFLTCSYKNVLTLSFIDDMKIIGECVNNVGNVSALIEQRDLDIKTPLIINLRPSTNWILEDTIPTHYGLNDITKIRLTNDGPDPINFNELGIYYYDNTSKYIKYNSNLFTLTVPKIQTQQYIETNNIIANTEIFEIKINASVNYTNAYNVFSTSFYSRIFVDLYNGTTFRRIELCLFNNIIHLTLFREPTGIPFATPTDTILSTSTTCSNSFAMNGYCSVTENELFQSPTTITFQKKPIIDIEGTIPTSFGIKVTNLEIYSQDDIILNEITIYYISTVSTHGIEKMTLEHYKYSITTNPVIKTYDTIKIPFGSKGIANILEHIDLPKYDYHLEYQVYRIKIKTSNLKFSKFFLRLKTELGYYVVTSCIGNNTYYLDLIGNAPINPKIECNPGLIDKQQFTFISLSTLKYYSIYEPYTANQLQLTGVGDNATYFLSFFRFTKKGVDLIDSVPGNIRNPMTNIYYITIFSNSSILTNNYIGIYYKSPSDSKIKYKKLDRYLISYSDTSKGAKLSDKPVNIKLDTYLLCMIDAINSYEIYEIELEMDNMDWSQVHIGLVDQTQNFYRNITCLLNQKLNIQTFGKIDTTKLIKNSLPCSNVVKGQAHAEITVKDLKTNLGFFHDNYLPLTFKYETVGGILGEIIKETGLTDVTSINIVNIGDIKIELSQVACYYTIAGNSTVVRSLFTILDDNMNNVTIPVTLLPGVNYQLLNSIDTTTIYIQRLEFITNNVGISHLELAITKKQKTSDGTTFTQINLQPVVEEVLFAFCVGNNVISLNFV